MNQQYPTRTLFPLSTLGFRCQCIGAIGDLCEFELNECSSNPCAEGSVCVDKMNEYQCICDPLRQGMHCNEVVPYCDRFAEPCKNDAACYSCNSETFKVKTHKVKAYTCFSHTVKCELVKLLNK